MITPGEIQQKAADAGVRDTQMEKDYILSWILQGIAEHSKLSSAIIFKGGTVLKKVYFSGYRFSEDLDFTLADENISNKQIFEWFKEVFAYIRVEANIPLDIIAENEHRDGGINFYISYVGPLGGTGKQKSVKVDISRNEKLIFPPVIRPALLSYSDQFEHQVLCYPLEEILIEKMRSVMQRMQARDLYDIWYLLEIKKMDPGFYLKEFQQKCKDKELKSTEFIAFLKKRLPQYKARWEGSISEQIHKLPAFDQVEREINRHFRNIAF